MAVIHEGSFCRVCATQFAAPELKSCPCCAGPIVPELYLARERPLVEIARRRSLREILQSRWTYLLAADAVLVIFLVLKGRWLFQVFS